MAEQIINDRQIPTIVACIDTTNASKAALIYACQIAKMKGFNVQILAILESSHKNLLFGAQAIGNEKREILEKHLKKLINIARENTGISPTMAIREGDIVSEIIKEIKKTPSCTMLVFGKSRNALSDNVVLPKIIQKVGSKINVPVTIVPGNLNHDFLENFV